MASKQEYVPSLDEFDEIFVENPGKNKQRRKKYS